MKKLIIIAAITLAIPLAISAAPIELGIGPRPQAMGLSYAAIANDVYAAYWNPAGLARLEKSEITGMYWMMPEIKNISVNYLAFVSPMKFGGNPAGIGFSLLRKAAALEEGPDDVQSDMSETVYSLSLGYGWRTRTAFGLTFNRYAINSKAGNGAGIGFDFGLWLRPFERSQFAVGAVARNVAANLKDEGFKPAYRIGLGYPVKELLIFSSDLSLKYGVNGEDKYGLDFGGGVEIRPIKQVAIRLGGGTQNTFAAGLGLTVKNVKVDYTFSLNKKEILGSDHRIALGYLFR